MYVLVKQEPRAATTDTILYYVSESHEALEEILLSIFDALYEHEMKVAKREYEEGYNYRNILTWCIHRMNCYKIINVAYLED